MFSTAEMQGKVNYIIKIGNFLLLVIIDDYLRPSNNSRMLIFSINAIV